MSGRIKSIIKMKNKALALFEETKSKLEYVQAKLSKEIDCSTGRIAEHKRLIQDEEAIIFEARSEMASTQRTIDNIDKILGE